MHMRTIISSIKIQYTRYRILNYVVIFTDDNSNIGASTYNKNSYVMYIIL